MLEYERKEKENQERLTAQVERHISTLKNLRVKLENRHDLKTRTEEYRNWQREFLPKKAAVMLGKTIEQTERDEAEKRVRNGSGNEETDDFIEQQLREHSKKAEQASLNKGGSSQELTTVLDSLNRLAELENRISSLEKDNKLDQLLALEKPTANQRTSIEFRKTRVPIGTAGSSSKGSAMGLKFQLKPVGRPPVSSGVAAVRAKQQGQGQEDDDYEEDYDADLEGSGLLERRTGPGTFITEGTDAGAAAKRCSRRHFRLSTIFSFWCLSSEQRGTASRASATDGARVGRPEEHAQSRADAQGTHKGAADRRQEARRSHEGAGSAAQGAGQRQPASGCRCFQAGYHASSEGHQRGHQKQEQASSRLRELETKPQKEKRSAAPNIAKYPSHNDFFLVLSEEMQKKLFSKDSASAAAATAYEHRFVSQTAPAYSNKNHPYHKISTQKEGTVTRRTNEKNAPIRRRQNNEAFDQPQAPLSAPPMIAVTGMGGLRVIRAVGRGRK